ncbi:MAG: WD40 repeat domain-containing protein, partial [Gemmataceae bacterium]
GKTLAVGTLKRIELVDAASGKERGHLVADMKVVCGLAFTPDGQTLVSLSADHKVRIWDVAARKVRRSFDAPSFNLGDKPMTLSPDGKTLAVRTEGCVIRRWDVASGRELHIPLPGHDAPVYSIGFSPDGHTLISSSRGQTRLWDAATWRPRRLLPQTAHALPPALGGKLLALEAIDNSSTVAPTVRVWDLSTGQDVRRLLLPTDNAILGNSWDPQLAVGGQVVVVMHYKFIGRKNPHCLTVWNAATGERLRTVSLGERVCRPAVSADGQTVVLGGDRQVLVCDLASGRLRALLGGDQECSRLAISPDGRLIAGVIAPAGERDFEGRTIRLWELASGQEVFTLRGHPRRIGPLAFSPNGRLLATGSGGWTYVKSATSAAEMRLWDVFNGREVGRFRGHDADTSVLAFTPDGARLVSGHDDGTLLVWEAGAHATPPAGKVGAEAVTRAWADLAADAPRAFRGRGVLASAPEKAMTLLTKHLRPAQPADPQRLRRLLADLDSEQFTTREKAQEELEKLGDLAEPVLRRTLDIKPTLEVRRRVQAILERLRGPVTRSEILQALRAVAVLEDIGTSKARRLLEELAKGTPEARLTREAKTSLRRLDLRGSSPSRDR